MRNWETNLDIKKRLYINNRSITESLCGHRTFVSSVYKRTHLELKTGSDRHRAEAELRNVNQRLSPPPPDRRDTVLGSTTRGP